MSAPKFRESDVVSWNSDLSGCAREFLVLEVSTMGIGAVRIGLPHPDERHGWRGLNDVTLLRRPVRAGDRLSSPGCDDSHEWEVTGISADRWHGSHETYLKFAERDSFGGWRHADGTPIDPPAPAIPSTPAGKVAFVSRLLGGRDENGEELPALISPDEARRLLDVPEPKSDIERMFDSMEKSALEQASARANRLSDECGALRSERDELLVENATLRRKVERLERGRR